MITITTIKDIAAEAGVTKVTVSNVINGNYSKVSATKIKEINDLLQKYNYVPNSSARSLKNKSTHIIAIIAYGYDEENAFENPYIAEIVGAITKEVQTRGYFVMLHLVSDCKDITYHLRSWNAEGAILLGMYDDSIQQIQDNSNIPLIFTDSYSSSRSITNVGLDNYKGGVLAANYFLSQGHCQFAFIGQSLESSPVIRHRMSGFIDTIKNHGISMAPENIIPVGTEIEMAERICSLNHRVTAIFTAADLTAVNLINGLRIKGYTVPDDFSIIGFDNLPISRYFIPKLTTISQDISRKAQTAVEVLFRHIKDPGMPHENIVLDVELIERESVKAPDIKNRKA